MGAEAKKCVKCGGRVEKLHLEICNDCHRAWMQGIDEGEAMEINAAVPYTEIGTGRPMLDLIIPVRPPTPPAFVSRPPPPGEVVLTQPDVDGRVTLVRQTLPTDSKARKDIPVVTGCLDYFPAALAAVAKLSKIGNDKHNPGQPLHHSRGKSGDHVDCIGRHLIDRDVIDPETGMVHMVEVAWRALALLQEMLEAAGAPLARAAWKDE